MTAATQASRLEQSRAAQAPASRATPMPPALVADVGWVNGLAAIRSLGRAGAPVLAVDHRRGALGFRSRYATPVLCPDPGAEEEAYVEYLSGLLERLDGRPVPVFPTHDEPLAVLARHRESFGERLRCPFPGWEALERLQSKRFQLEQAAEAGVPAPATAHPTSAAEALASARSLGYPVLVKPSSPIGFRRRFRRQAFRCETPAELERAYADGEPYEPMVQELVPGGDEELYTLGSYLAADGTPLAVFTGRKLRQTPRGIGTCRVGEAVWVEEVAELGLRLLHALAFHGLSQVEFKRDPRSGRFLLMEVNPRLWQWHGLAAACGVDLPRIAYWDLLGARVVAPRQCDDGRRWAISLLRGERPALQRPPYVDAVFAADDPLPALVQAARLVKGLAR